MTSPNRLIPAEGPLFVSPRIPPRRYVITLRYHERMKLGDIWRIGAATARLTRAVVADDIGERLVQRPTEIAYPDPDSAPRVLVSCPWCIGFWITLGVLVVEQTPLGRTAFWRTLTTALAAHWTVTHVAMALGDYDEVGEDDENWTDYTYAAKDR